MKKFLVLSVVGLFVASAVAPVFAAMPAPYGWYLEANAGKSSASGKSFPGKVKHTGFGESINGGYKFSQFIAGEVGFTNYANTRIQTPSGTNVAKDRHYSYDIAGKLMLPVGVTGTEVYGKVGIGRVNSNVTVTNEAAAAANGMAFNAGTHTKNGLYLGAGADYALSPNVLVNLQWARQNGSNNTGVLDLYSLGLAYIF